MAPRSTRRANQSEIMEMDLITHHVVLQLLHNLQPNGLYIPSQTPWEIGPD